MCQVWSEVSSPLAELRTKDILSCLAREILKSGAVVSVGTKSNGLYENWSWFVLSVTATVQKCIRPGGVFVPGGKVMWAALRRSVGEM